MTDAVIFTRDACPYCVKAKALLSQEGYTYEEKRWPDQVSKDDIKAVMPLAAQTRFTFPQIVVHGQYVGGCDDLEDFFWEEYDNRPDDQMYAAEIVGED